MTFNFIDFLPDFEEIFHCTGRPCNRQYRLAATQIDAVPGGISIEKK
jgi:hypothetical protein